MKPVAARNANDLALAHELDESRIALQRSVEVDGKVEIEGHNHPPPAVAIAEAFAT